MAAIEVTPAGNQLYEVVVNDRDYESRHRVTVPDDLVERMDTDGVAMQDVVLTATQFLLEREGHDQLDPEIDLGVVADRYDGFVAELPERARERARHEAPPTGNHVDDRQEPTGDERLRAEVERDQQTGQASSQDRRF